MGLSTRLDFVFLNIDTATPYVKACARQRFWTSIRVQRTKDYWYFAMWMIQYCGPVAQKGEIRPKISRIHKRFVYSPNYEMKKSWRIWNWFPGCVQILAGILRNRAEEEEL